MRYTQPYIDFVENKLIDEILLKESVDDYNTGIDEILLDKEFLYKISYSSLWTKEEGEYIRDVISLNESENLNESEIHLLFVGYNDDTLNEAMTNLQVPKLKAISAVPKVSQPHSMIKIVHTNKNRPAKIKLATKIKNTSLKVKDKVSGWLQKLAKKITEYKNYIMTSVIGSLTAYTEKSKKYNSSMSNNVFEKYKDHILSHEDLKHKDDIKERIDENKEQITWITKVYNFIKTNVFDKLVGGMKEGVGKLINFKVKESILKGEWDLFDLINESGAPGKLKVHNVHLHILKLIGKVDQWLHEKFKFIFDAFAAVTGFGMAGLVKLMNKLGGPAAPDNLGLLSRSGTMTMHYFYSDLETKAYRYLNPKAMLSGIIKNAAKGASIAAIPAISIYYTIIGWINKVDVTRGVANLAFAEDQKLLKKV